MTPEQQRTAIAEACGYTFICTCNKDTSAECLYGTAPDGKEARLPDYLNDLNAMHEAEQFITHSQIEIYEEWLRDSNSSGAYPAQERRWHKTAAQRAEAFLRTLNLWTPS